VPSSGITQKSRILWASTDSQLFRKKDAAD